MSKVRNKKTNFNAIGKLLRFAKPYVPAILLALFFSILQIIATLFAPVIIGKTVDSIIGKDNVDFSVIAKNAGILAGLIAAVLLFQYLSSLCINFASFRTIRDLRREAFKKLNVVPLSYIDSNSHGDLMSRVGNDVDQISDGLIQGFSQLFGGIVTIVGTLVFMLTYNWLIAVIVVVLTPISLFVAYFIAKGCHDTFAKQAEKRGELSGLVTEMTSNQRVVKLFGYEKRAEERFAVINQDLKISGQNAAFFSALVNPSTRFVNNVIYAVVCILGAWLVIRGQGILGMGAFTVGGLSCVLSYAIQYTKPFNEITGVVTELQTATAAADRVFNLLETENQSSDEGFPDLENVKGNIEIDNVYFSYVKSNPLIQGFSLSVKNGKRVAIVGPTGCGKTTLINLLMRFYDVQAGVVLLGGRDVRSIPTAELMEQISFVFQEVRLFKKSIRDNIRAARPDATEEEILHAAQLAQCSDILEKTPGGLDAVIGAKGVYLSGGEMQRIALARAILKDAPIVVLDEASSFADPENEAKIQKAFEALMKGKTVLMIAHRLSTVRNMDRILVIRDGEIAEEGKHDELLQKGGVYAAMWEEYQKAAQWKVGGAA